MDRLSSLPYQEPVNRPEEGEKSDALHQVSPSLSGINGVVKKPPRTEGGAGTEDLRSRPTTTDMEQLKAMHERLLAHGKTVATPQAQSSQTVQPQGVTQEENNFGPQTQEILARLVASLQQPSSIGMQGDGSSQPGISPGASISTWLTGSDSQTASPDTAALNTVAALFSEANYEAVIDLLSKVTPDKLKEMLSKEIQEIRKDPGLKGESPQTLKNLNTIVEAVYTGLLQGAGSYITPVLNGSTTPAKTGSEIVVDGKTLTKKELLNLVKEMATLIIHVLETDNNLPPALKKLVNEIVALLKNIESEIKQYEEQQEEKEEAEKNAAQAESLSASLQSQEEVEAMLVRILRTSYFGNRHSFQVDFFNQLLTETSRRDFSSWLQSRMSMIEKQIAHFVTEIKDKSRIDNASKDRLSGYEKQLNILEKAPHNPRLANFLPKDMEESLARMRSSLQVAKNMLSTEG